MVANWTVSDWMALKEVGSEQPPHGFSTKDLVQLFSAHGSAQSTHKPRYPLEHSLDVHTYPSQLLCEIEEDVEPIKEAIILVEFVFEVHAILSVIVGS
jgi:hypothetical protein